MNLIEGITMKTLSEQIAFFMLTAGFIGLLYKIIRSIVLFAKKTWDRLEVAFEQLTYVHKEIKPNSGSSLYDKINKIQNEVAILRQDITIQHIITRQIRDDMANIPYCEFDVSGNLKFANKKFQALFKTHEDQLEELGWFSLLPEEARVSVFNRWSDSMKNGTPFQATLNGFGDDEGVLTYILKTEQVKDGDGKIIYVIGKISKK